MSRTPKRDQAHAVARRAQQREQEELRAALQGGAPRPTVGAPERGDRRASLRERLPREGLATLAEQGIEVGEHGAITSGGKPVGQVREAWPGADAPFRVQALRGLELHKPRALRSPTWIALVRMMPCAFCPHPRGFSLRVQVQGGLYGKTQSEAHHVPSRGRGGSDLETCPACHACHERCTRHEIPEDLQVRAVAATMREILAGIREGWLQSGLLLAVAIEAVI